MNTTTYDVPDNPTDPEAAALELIVRLPEDVLHTTALRPVLQDWAKAIVAATAVDAQNILSITKNRL